MYISTNTTTTSTYIMYTITIHSLYSSHMYRASVEVMVWYGDIESHTGGGVQSTLTLAATSRLTADTSPDSAARSRAFSSCTHYEHVHIIKIKYTHTR